MQTRSIAVTASLRAFMANLIDYAGLFPPANLVLPEAIQNYARYRQSPDRWMLSRFIIPAAQLGELSAFGDLFRGGDPFVFSALGRGGRDTEEFFAGLEAAVKAIEAFRQEHGSSVIVDVFEIKLPGSMTSANNVSEIIDLLSKSADLLNSAGQIAVYYEVASTPSWEQSVRGTIEAIAENNAKQKRQAGFKLRCGGVEISAFPTPAQIALALLACRDAGISLKATAGLHHPIRRFDRSVQTKMHGFLNVLGAGILAHVHKLKQGQIETIIEDEIAAHFQFSAGGFAWNDLEATSDEIAAIRKSALVSFGSCSFDEPREDLQSLGLLRRQVIENTL
jgi:hypothetical protein